MMMHLGAQTERFSADAAAGARRQGEFCAKPAGERTDKSMQKIVRRPIVAGSSAGWPVDLHPVLRRVYLGRKLAAAEELDLSLSRLLPGSPLTGLEAAVDLLQWALREHKRILIVADFDADGATGCALAMRGLRALGAADVRYVVPDRFRYGYGLSPEIVTVAAQQQPDLLMTVDNGISSLEGVAAARERGIRVLVTDHHLPGVEIPAADAIVNPNCSGDPFPSKSLAGVGVVFYVLAALRARLREYAWFVTTSRAEPNLAQFLDLVALGTVADVVPLDHNNRILVEHGIRRIRGGRCCTGIRSLLEVAGRDHRDVVAADLGFAVGPRLNAAGRLTDMSLGIECLLSEDPVRARRMARHLDRLNAERREIEQRMKEQAHVLVDELDLGQREELPFALCLFDEGWHQGVVGLLASRLKDRYHRPVIGFAPGENGQLKGSARSVPGFHIRDALDRVASGNPGLLRKFGGHAMAAGVSLAREHLGPFAAAFEAEARRGLAPEDLHGVVHSDGELEPPDLSLEVAELLRGAGPWGQAFPEPVFDGVFGVLEQRIVRERHLKLRLQVSRHGPQLEAIAFNQSEFAAPRSGDAVRLAYQLDVNTYRGLRSVQLRVQQIEQACGSSPKDQR
jgi:single-stranded-DNA-specific exonuclease